MVSELLLDVKEGLSKSLLDAEKITPEDIQRAQELMCAGVKISFGAALIRIGAVSEDNLLDALSALLKLKIANESDIPDPQKLYRDLNNGPINFDWFVSKKCLFGRSKTSFGVCRDLFDPSVHEVLRRFFSPKAISFMLIPNHLLDRSLELIDKEHSRESFFNESESRQLRELAEEAPVIEFVNNFIAQAVDAKASDIHIEPEEEEFKVRFRVDGVLHDKVTQPIKRFSAIASRIKLVSGLDIAERRVPQDGRMTTRMGGVEIDVRVSSVPSVRGESLVMRLLPKDSKEVELTRLGMETDHHDKMVSWSRLNSGIILVTGPTGSGKSTTLHAALRESDDGARKIITVEDPVEKQVAGITQIQTHEEIGYTFANALRAILRQDPDVIMVGEIRDLETAEIAIQAALSGHLVFSTLHTNDALSSFTRLIDMGVEPFLVAAPVKGVQAQRLVRRLCAICSRSCDPPASLIPGVSSNIADRLGSDWRQPVGCEECQNSGFSGRIGIYELIEVGTQIQDLVVKGGTINELRKLARAQGARTLFEDGLVKASHGKTSVDELYRVVTSEQED